VVARAEAGLIPVRRSLLSRRGAAKVDGEGDQPI
jgi:hypothetical protein